ncbi:hypothetical protein OQA88_10290 [Cercophora sp. LCS_1]
MKGVTIKDTGYRQAFEARLYLLDLANAGEHLVTRLVQISPSFVRSPGGFELPVELWYMVMGHLAAMPRATPRYCLVKAKVISKEPKKRRIIRCVQYELVADWSKLGNVGSKHQLQALGGFFRKPTEATVKKVRAQEKKDWESNPARNTCQDRRMTARFPDARLLTGPENTFYVFLNGEIQDASDILMKDLELPDVLAHIGGGKCGLCKGNRYICPCCVSSATMEAFNIIAIGGVQLVCPVCMGLKLAHDHYAHLSRHYPRISSGFRWPRDNDGRIAQENLHERINQRLDQLGYEWGGWSLDVL